MILTEIQISYRSRSEAQGLYSGASEAMGVTGR
jgi:hypothetical protein